MDASAIQKIAGLALAATAIPDEHTGKAIALHRDVELYDMEHFGAGRRRFRGTLNTTSLTDFIAYVKAHRGEGFIDAERLSATVFFNLGDASAPGHGDWRAILTMKATAAFAALRKLDGQQQTQRSLIDFLEDWGQFLTPYGQDGAENPSMAKAIAAIRSVTIKATSETETNQGDFNASRSALDEIEARSRHTLPGGFVFTTEPYLGLPSRDFKLRLSVLTDAKEPRLVLRMVQREAQDEAIAQDFKRVLIEEIGEAATLTIGTFAP